MQDMFHNLGHEDGARDGARAGHLDGRDFGARKALAMGRELGFYYGVTQRWLVYLRPSASSSSSITSVVSPPGIRNTERTRKQLTDVINLIERYPAVNDLETDFIQLMDRIRTKFKLAMVNLGSSQKYRGGGLDTTNDAVTPSPAVAAALANGKQMTF
ncbi:hypothetical protein IWQ60_003904 [Tieghemiomyces parasiticus]|uniref:Essential protein Yae1 N-terminal domain-containing protein n=1 Tax=Tieghemiomyces parasiticus TaxID=78921 RepID=A0A9W8DZL8_9FUNG|nr:hypothetical protein IWQ60_003904 [Tieghemiomyces parasiticus]